MRRLLTGLAVVASLVTSLIGSLDTRDIPVTAACGGRYEDDCDFDALDRPDPFEEEYPQPNEQEKQAWRLQSARNAWAVEHLPAERAAATWWRGGGPQYDPVSGQRGQGMLVEQVPSDREIIYYECDLNYGDAESGGCVPNDRDYDCDQLRSWGIASISVIGDDWMLLDDDGDGWGCEPTFVPTQVVQAVAPTPESDNKCDGVVGRVDCFLFGP